MVHIAGLVKHIPTFPTFLHIYFEWRNINIIKDGVSFPLLPTSCFSLPVRNYEPQSDKWTLAECKCFAFIPAADRVIALPPKLWMIALKRARRSAAPPEETRRQPPPPPHTPAGRRRWPFSPLRSTTGPTN